MKRWSLALATLILGAFAGSYFVGPLLHGQPTPTPPVVKELTSYRDIVKKVLPAVVSIETKSKITRIKAKQPSNTIPDDLFDEFNRAPFDQEVPRQGFGSGFFIAPEGVILTNFHVVNGADQVTVTLMDGRKFVSKDIRGDRRTDLAIVRLDKSAGNFPYLELGDSDAMEIGDRVLAIGAPFGLTGSVTHGIVSAKGRNGLNMNMYEDFLQTDAAINPGNSGGPLISLDGKVIGINAAIKTRSGGFQGVGLAVASNLAKHVSKALLKDGVVHRGYLGVQIRQLDPEVARRLGVPKDTGVVVGQVFDHSPAAKTGLKPADIITDIAGQKVKDGRTLQTIVAGLDLQKATEVTVLRDGKNMVLTVTIEEQPSDFGTARVPVPRTPKSNADGITIDKIGVEIADLTEEMADDLGYAKNTRGVVITRVEPATVASAASLRRGMVIAKVDNHKVTSAAGVRQALERASLARGILLQVQSPQGGTNFVLLRQSDNN